MKTNMQNQMATGLMEGFTRIVVLLRNLNQVTILGTLLFTIYPLW